MTTLIILPLCSMAAAEKPNIVYMMVDDLGPFDLSCMGSEILETPNIDRIAHEGIRFTRAYSGGTVCAPARSTLLTGKHMGHTTVRGNLGGISLRADDVTVSGGRMWFGQVSTPRRGPVARVIRCVALRRARRKRPQALHLLRQEIKTGDSHLPMAARVADDHLDGQHSVRLFKQLGPT